jgi:spore germination cell wall hydrolase CwlJ-like protein
MLQRIKNKSRLMSAIAIVAASATVGMASATPVPPTPVVEPVVEVIEPVLTPEDKRQIECLAINAYHEAGNQSRRGKIAVSNVVMNRVKDERFPKTPCAVIYQRTRRVCQFSWTCMGNMKVRSAEQYAESRETAEEVYLEDVEDVTNGAKFYHATYVNPRWRYQRIIQIGDHIFYRG